MTEPREGDESRETAAFEIVGPGGRRRRMTKEDIPPTPEYKESDRERRQKRRHEERFRKPDEDDGAEESSVEVEKPLEQVGKSENFRMARRDLEASHARTMPSLNNTVEESATSTSEKAIGKSKATLAEDKTSDCTQGGEYQASVCSNDPSRCIGPMENVPPPSEEGTNASPVNGRELAFWRENGEAIHRLIQAHAQARPRQDGSKTPAQNAEAKQAWERKTLGLLGDSIRNGKRHIQAYRRLQRQSEDSASHENVKKSILERLQVLQGDVGLHRYFSEKDRGVFGRFSDRNPTYEEAEEYEPGGQYTEVDYTAP